MRRILFHAFTSKYVAFAFVKSTYVFAAPHNVFVFDRWGHFSALQNSFHIEWAHTFCSTLESRLRYTRSSTFDTFPFPSNFAGIEELGRVYHTSRGSIMMDRKEGLTSTYNRFHNPDETAGDIARLRELHRQLDAGVAAAYAWTDLAANQGAALRHDFRETKRGVRWTLHPEVCDDVLDRAAHPQPPPLRRGSRSWTAQQRRKERWLQEVQAGSRRPTPFSRWARNSGIEAAICVRMSLTLLGPLTSPAPNIGTIPTVGFHGHRWSVR